MHVVTKRILNQQNVLLIQPYIKWGPRKNPIKPEHQLAEAESLVRTLPNWKVELSLKIPVESMDRRMIFGRGKLEELRDMINDARAHGKHFTCMFISVSTLSLVQRHTLEEYFNLPLMDRYSIVIQILRLHATSTEAKLQVALAELPYIWSQIRDIELQASAEIQRKNFHLSEDQKMMLRAREKKIKSQLEELRVRRELLRNNRRAKQFPVIAVVGYTNCGKTSLIKALTEEASLQPRNQLFATLDVTAHAGLLPCRLEVLYMDTVGFMSDIPTGLLECFVATLEDALDADVIIHLQDMSHENWREQKQHVETTLASLIRNNTNQTNHIMENVINVGNKIDLVNETERNFGDLITISSTTLAGINELLEVIQARTLEVTNRFPLTMRVPNGGDEMQWLYKNAAVTGCEECLKDSQMILVHVVISEAKLEQFKHHFVRIKKK
jgi:GTP-binding protein HflX